MPVRTNIVTPASATAPAPAPSTVDVSSTTRSLLQVLDAGGTGTAQVLKSPHWPDLIISSGGDYAMRTGPLESYVAGFEASLDVASISKYTGGPLDDTLRTSLDTLRWIALLHAPLAEIADRLPHPAHARLSGLPGFTYLPHSLQHMRMAAWLTKHSASPQELADIVSVDEETAQRFLGACAALGLLQEVSETSKADEAESASPMSEETEALAAVNPLKNGEALSVLERLRATREQNRGRAVAAIRGVSNS